MKSIHLALLAVILLAGAVLRSRGDALLALEPAEARAIPSRTLLDDVETCAHLRRIELALGAPRAPATDAYLAHPLGAEWPWPPFFDTLVAGYASAALRAPDGEAELGGVSESALERFASRLGPLLGLLAVLATWLAARAIAKGERREEAALWAAAFVACSPAAIGASAAGRLDHHALLALFAALAFFAVAQVIAARGLRDTLVAALPAGALLGLACATSLLGAAVFGAAWVACWFAARNASAEEKRDAQRAGLLVCVVAAFTAQLPLAPETETWETLGLVAGTHAALVALALVATLPFLAGFFLGGQRERRFFRTVTLIVALVLIAYSLPRFAERIVEAARHFARTRGTLAALFPELRAVWDAPLALVVQLGVLATPAWLVVPWVHRRFAGDPRSALGALVVTGIAITALLALGGAGAASLFAVAVALGVAWCAASGRSVRVTRGLLGAALAVNLLVASSASAPGLASDRSTRVALAEGLRTLRGSADASWNSARSSAANGVLTVPSWAAQAVYHARVPVVCAPHSALTQPGAFEAYARAWLADDVGALVRFARANDVRFVAVGPAAVDDMGCLASLARADVRGRWEATALGQLGRAGPRSTFPGLRRVYAAEERAGSNGPDDPPLVTLWEIEPEPRGGATPELRAR